MGIQQQEQGHLLALRLPLEGKSSLITKLINVDNLMETVLEEGQEQQQLQLQELEQQLLVEQGHLVEIDLQGLEPQVLLQIEELAQEQRPKKGLLPNQTIEHLLKEELQALELGLLIRKEEPLALAQEVPQARNVELQERPLVLLEQDQAEVRDQEALVPPQPLEKEDKPLKN